VHAGKGMVGIHNDILKINKKILKKDLEKYLQNSWKTGIKKEYFKKKR